MSRKDIILTLLDQLEEMTAFVAHNCDGDETNQLVSEALELIDRYREEYPNE